MAKRSSKSLSAKRPIKERSARRVLVFLPPANQSTSKAAWSSATVVRFASQNPGGGFESGETPIALLPKATQFDLVFDSADVFTAAIDAPKLSEARLRLALPNLLEDRLLSDPGDCHFAFTLASGAGGDTTPGQPARLPVAAIDRGTLTRALDALNSAGQKARAAYAELYTVPAPEAGVLAVRIERGRGVVRTGPHEGFAFDLPTVDPARSKVRVATLRDGEVPVSAHAAGQGAELPTTLLLAIRQLGIRRVLAFGADAPRLVAMAAALGVEVINAGKAADLDATSVAVDLLQGSFAPASMFSGLLSVAGGKRLHSGVLLWPLIWLGIAGVIFVLGMNAYWLKLDSETKAIRGQMESAFRSAFPEATAIVDPVLQTRRQLGGLRARVGQPSADDFSVLNAQAVQLLASAPLGSVTGVEYRDGVFAIKFKPGMGQEPALQNALRAQAVQQGLALRFDSDGTARLSPAGQ